MANITQYEARVINSICEASNSPEYQKAKHEWDLSHVEYYRSKCQACGKDPIVWRFILKNKLNGNQLVLGSECIVNYLVIDGRDRDQMVELVKEMLKKALDHERATEFEESFPWAVAMMKNPDGKLVANPKVKRMVKYFTDRGFLTVRQRQILVAIVLEKAEADMQVELNRLVDRGLTHGEAENQLIYPLPQGVEIPSRVLRVQATQHLQVILDDKKFTPGIKARYRGILLRLDAGEKVSQRQQDALSRGIKVAQNRRES